jgi:hypothetical protein
MIGVSLRAEIEHTFQVAVARCTTDELVIVCPECGDVSGNRSINLKTGVTFCWRCNKGKHNKGNFLAWARANGHTFSNTSDMTSVPVSEVLIAPAQAKSRVPYVKEIPLPKGYVYLRDEPTSGYAKLIGRMAARKNLTLQDFIEADAGFTRTDALWEPFCIFPVKELGRIVYYQGRTYVDVPDQTTKKFPSRNEVPYGASCWIYNYDEMYRLEAPTVIVVESILNVLSLRKKLARLGIKDVVPVCVFKHSVSSVQATKLFQCKWLKEICMLFDHDAIDATWSQMKNVGNMAKMTVAEMPSGVNNKKLDPNDDVEAAWVAFEQRKAYTAGSALERLWSVRPPSRNLSSIDISKCRRLKDCS